jgi:LysR family glycine cleavage system transcriptional activator
MKPHLPLNHLNVFASAAEKMSFQAAAKQLHVTPSAVSHQIRNLESRLDYPLFDRIDNGIRLTPLGQQLFAEIREPLNQLHEAALRAARAPDDRLLTVSVAPLFATRWLMPRLKDFQRQHPDISLSVIAAIDLVDFSRDGIGAAIRIGDGQWPGTDSTLLFRPRVAAVCRPGLVADHHQRLSVDELLKLQRIDNTAVPDQWKSWCHAAGLQRPPGVAAVQVQSAVQALEAVQTGDFIALLDLHLVADELGAGRIALACDFIQRSNHAYYLVLPRGLDTSPAQATFANWVAAAAARGGR